MTGTRRRDQALEKELAGLERMPELLRQAGALAWLPGRRRRRFVIVTSRRTGRWVFPKGSIDPGMTPPEAAAHEALEEAGVVGRPRKRRIGRFATVKIRPPLYWNVEVGLYPIRIEQVLDDWPEQGERERRFVTLSQARKLMADPAMTRLAARFLSRDE